jgi:rsbT co-antagonist protein RsbR
MKENATMISAVIEKQQKKLLDDWMACQRRDGAFRGRQKENDVIDQARRFLDALREGAGSGRFEDITTPEWAATRDVLDEVTRSRVTEGFTPAETATFVFSFKEPLFALLRGETGKNTEKFVQDIWAATLLLDKLGLYTTEAYQKSREEVILRQQQDLLELSTPVVQLWEGVLALPLIGTLDSARTQVVMESLLEQIVSSGAEIAIIDITGVPTVDTLVAQHLIKTVSAARLMGADCIISGIRPQIAQTIVHLGLELDVISKATMEDAFALALKRLGKTVVDRAKLTRREE